MTQSFGPLQAIGLFTLSERALRHCVRVAIAFVAMTLAGLASAQAPQSRFADANGVRIHYLVAVRETPSSCCTATRRPATCGCR